MDFRLGSKFASEVGIFAYFSISNFFMCQFSNHHMTHCLHYFVASFNYGESSARDIALPIDQSEQLPDSISNCDVSMSCYMLFLFLFVCFIFLFLSFVWFFYFFLGIVTYFYRYSRLQILICYYNTSELGKTLSYEGLKHLRLAFNKPLSLKQVCEFQTWIFIASFLCFVFYIVRISDQGSLGLYSHSKLRDRMLRLHSYQP